MHRSTVEVPGSLLRLASLMNDVTKDSLQMGQKSLTDSEVSPARERRQRDLLESRGSRGIYPCADHLVGKWEGARHFELENRIHYSIYLKLIISIFNDPGTLFSLLPVWLFVGLRVATSIPGLPLAGQVPT